MSGKKHKTRLYALHRVPFSLNSQLTTETTPTNLIDIIFENLIHLGALKLIDISSELPALSRKPGISTWKVRLLLISDLNMMPV